MIEAYANQSLTLEKAGALNSYGEFTYATSTIKGRKQTEFKLVRNSTGQEVVSTAQVFTTTAITVNDRIDGQVVIAVQSAVDIDGAVQFYQVYLS